MIYDIADCDPDFRCVMRKPRKRQMLRSVGVAFVFWLSGKAMDGIGAERSASALRRSGFSTIVGENHTPLRSARGEILGYFFSFSA